MLGDNSVCINSKTFEIIELENSFIINQKMGEIISILNKKGYYTKICSLASLSKPILIADLVNNFINSGLLEINDNTNKKLKEIVGKVDFESTLIIFKNKYLFDDLPKGFKIIDNDLYYNLKILKDCSQIKFKTLMELENENENSLNELKKWAEKLPTLVK